LWGGRSRISQRQYPLTDTYLVTLLDVNPGYSPGGSRRNGCDRLFILQFENRLIFGKLIALFYKEVHHRARIGSFAQVR
jgi:hypothetical protein